MKQFRKILKFEIKNYYANKAFIGITAFIMITIIAVMFFPRIKEVFKNDDKNTSAVSDEKSVMLLVGESAELSKDAFASAFKNYDVKLSKDDIDAIKEQVVSGKIECAFALDSLTTYTYYVNNLSMYDNNTLTADKVLQDVYRMSAMIDGGMSPDDAASVMSMQISHETKTLGKDQMQNYFYTYIMVFALYMVILLYGQMIATNVATEKSSRAMEVLITSAKPTSMMFGKVIASCLAGFTQLVVVFGAAFVSFNLNKSYWDSNDIISSIFDMPLELVVYMLIFFVLGFLVYAFMFGAVGSTASKLEDINTSVMPIIFMFVAAFIIVVTGLASNDVNTLLMTVCSYIPFTSPMAMFSRIAMSTVPFYEIAISIAILIGSVFGIGLISAKIYRVGVLLYGTPPKIGAIIKAIRKS